MLLFICDRPTKKVTHRHPTSYKMKAWENESQVSRYEWILSSISTCENQQNLGLVISPAQNCPSRAHNRGYRRAASAPSSTKLLQKNFNCQIIFEYRVCSHPRAQVYYPQPFPLPTRRQAQTTPPNHLPRDPPSIDWLHSTQPTT